MKAYIYRTGEGWDYCFNKKHINMEGILEGAHITLPKEEVRRLKTINAEDFRKSGWLDQHLEWLYGIYARKENFIKK